MISLKESKVEIACRLGAALSLLSTGFVYHPETAQSTFGALRFRAEGLCSYDNKELGIQISFADQASEKRGVVIYVLRENDFGLSAISYTPKPTPTTFHYFQEYFINQSREHYDYKEGQLYLFKAYAIDPNAAKKSKSPIESLTRSMPDEAFLIGKAEARINCRPPLSEITA